MKARLAIASLAFCFIQSQALPPAVGQAPPAVAAMSADQELKAMEGKFFEHDFSKESVDYRVQRLEKFAFGQPGTGPVDARLKRLATVIDLHPNLVLQQPKAAPAGSAPASAAGSPAYDASKDDPSERGHYPHITVLEQEVLGQTFESDTLNARLSRLETKAFGSPSSETDAATRTDALQTYAERKLHKTAYNENPDVTGAGRGNKSLKWVEDYRPRQQIVEPMQTVAGQSEDDDAAPRQAALPALDPAVFKQAPPDEHGRMLTRVSWCEQHLFGRTFPEQHLQQRLHQLNTELFPNDKEPDIKLMDRLDVIVKEVVMRQHPPIALK